MASNCSFAPNGPTIRATCQKGPCLRAILKQAGIEPEVFLKK